MRVKDAIDKINKINRVLLTLDTAEDLGEELIMAAELLEDYKKFLRQLSLNVAETYEWNSSEYTIPGKEDTYFVWLEGDVVDVAIWRNGEFCPWYAYYFEDCPPEWNKKVLAWMPVKPYAEAEG